VASKILNGVFNSFGGGNLIEKTKPIRCEQVSHRPRGATFGTTESRKNEKRKCFFYTLRDFNYFDLPEHRLFFLFMGANKLIFNPNKYAKKELVVYNASDNSIATIEQGTLHAIIRYKKSQALNSECGDLIVSTNMVENLVKNHEEVILLGEL